ncbi:RNA polymerase sigma factor [Streptomyces kaempferi]
MCEAIHASSSASRDPEAFRQLFQELGQAIYAHAYRATGDWSAAEDAVSLTFLEVWRLRERLEEGTRVSAPGSTASPPTSCATADVQRANTN